MAEHLPARIRGGRGVNRSAVGVEKDDADAGIPHRFHGMGAGIRPQGGRGPDAKAGLFPVLAAGF